MTITSHHNQKLKEIRKLHQRRRWRERSRRFVAEGEDLLTAADGAGWQPVERYCAAGSGLAGVEVEADVLASASGLGSGTRTLAVYEERWTPAPVGPLCVYLHGVRDPGNVGTILRSAEAFGVGSVVLGPGSADPFSPKAVRASMGAVFTVPLVRWSGNLDALPGIKIALMPGQGVPIDEVWQFAPTPGEEMANLCEEGHRGDGPVRFTLLIGAERDGLSSETVEEADHLAHIPIATDSLNAAMAATVALYELRIRMPAR